MASAQKKVIVRRFDASLSWGYLPQSAFLDAAHVPLMAVDGKLNPLPVSDIKMIAYVRDFNLNDPLDPERLGRKAFLSRPRGDGLWLRLTLRDGDILEGLAAFDLNLLDSLIDDRGLFLTPPDGRSNTLRLFLPRPAIRSVDVLGLIQAPSRRLTAKLAPTPELTAQPSLFTDPPADPPLPPPSPLQSGT